LFVWLFGVLVLVVCLWVCGVCVLMLVWCACAAFVRLSFYAFDNHDDLHFAALTIADTALVGLGSLVTIGNIPNAATDWLCWKTDPTATVSPPITAADCSASLGGAADFGSAGAAVTCSGASGTSLGIRVDADRYISIIACSQAGLAGVATSVANTFTITAPAAGALSSVYSLRFPGLGGGVCLFSLAVVAVILSVCLFMGFVFLVFVWPC
jgi:hypothetical protein